MGGYMHSKNLTKKKKISCCWYLTYSPQDVAAIDEQREEKEHYFQLKRKNDLGLVLTSTLMNLKPKKNWKDILPRKDFRAGSVYSLSMHLLILNKVAQRRSIFYSSMTEFSYYVFQQAILLKINMN